MVVSTELYGFPGRRDEIKMICEKHGALLIEDVAKAMRAIIDGRRSGSFEDYSAVRYNGNNVLGMLGDVEFCNKVAEKPLKSAG